MLCDFTILTWSLMCILGSIITRKNGPQYFAFNHQACHAYHKTKVSEVLFLCVRSTISNLNIIQIHSSVLWQWQYFVEYSIIQNVWGILCRKLCVPHNIVMDMNNVMMMYHMRPYSTPHAKNVHHIDLRMVSCSSQLQITKIVISSSNSEGKGLGVT